MKINEIYLSKENITVESYLKKFGINDIENFIEPDSNCIDNYQGYYNIDKAVEMFNKHLNSLSDTYIICDSDLDGITSATMLYNYMLDINDQWNVGMLVHEGKERGLQDELIFNHILENPRPFVIIPDAGTNDKEQAKKLAELGIDLLVLDHHDIETPIENGVLINNQNPNNKNISKNGSGCLVVYMFIKANNYLLYPFEFWDMVAISLISDSMDMSDIQNRTFYHYGLEVFDNIQNPFLKATFEKFIGNKSYTQRDISFKIVPKFNSVIRAESQELKYQVIENFIDEFNDYDTILEKCAECHKNQIKLVDDIINNHKDEIDKASNNNIVLLSCNDMPRSYSGLVAGKIMNICNRPTIVGKVKDNKLIGSLRSPVPLRNALNENTLVEWAIGHENSCGISIDAENIVKLIDYYNTLNISYEPHIDVLRAYSINDIPDSIYDLFDTEFDVLWGYGLPKPIFEIHDIIYSPSDIMILGVNKRTIKIINNGVNFLLFNVTKQQKADLGLGDIIDGEFYENIKTTKYCLSCIGSLSVNRYKSYVNNQMIIDTFNVKEYNPKTIDSVFRKR